MKELSIEQKAKAYDEVISKLKGFMAQGVDPLITRADVQDFFPELKESEDERIRKGIIDFLWKEKIFLKEAHSSVENNPKYRFVMDAIAWLEKQGDTLKEVTCTQEVEVGNGNIKVLVTEKLDSTNASTENDVRRRSTIQVLEYARSLDAYNQFGKADIDKNIAWLEKQGEEDSSIQQAYKQGYIEGQRIERKCWLEKQGQQKYIPKYKIGDYVKNTNYKGEPIYEIIYMDKECYICEYRGKERMGDKAVMHFSFDNPYLCLVQKSDDKVKPKFNEGDWVVDNNGKVAIIYDLQKAGYVGHYTNGTDFVCKYGNEHLLHLWTIKDAKDGDILVNGSNIFIFSHLSDTRAMGYCHINLDDGRFYDDKDKTECFGLIDAVFSPATKEQRDLLFQKMKEAGYEWDENKKELRKIEQKSKWTDEDEENMQHCCGAVAAADYYTLEDKEEMANWLVSLKQRIHVSSAKTCKNDTLLDLLHKMPSYITLDGISYHFMLRKTAISYTAFYEGEGEGSGKVIFCTAGEPIELLTAMLEKLKKEGLLE